MNRTTAPEGGRSAHQQHNRSATSRKLLFLRDGTVLDASDARRDGSGLELSDPWLRVGRSRHKPSQTRWIADREVRKVKDVVA